MGVYEGWEGGRADGRAGAALCVAADQRTKAPPSPRLGGEAPSLLQQAAKRRSCDQVKADGSADGMALAALGRGEAAVYGRPARTIAHPGHPRPCSSVGHHLRAVRDAKPQDAPPRLDQRMFLWASYVVGQDRNEVESV
jgi:hypothetical protein